MKFCKFCNGLIAFENGLARCISCKKEFNDFELSANESGIKKSEVQLINEKESEVLPRIHHKCKKCDSEYAYFWHTHGIGDEADTIYYKCVKCNCTVQQGGQRGGR